MHVHPLAGPEAKRDRQETLVGRSFVDVRGIPKEVRTRTSKGGAAGLCILASTIEWRAETAQTRTAGLEVFDRWISSTLTRMEQ